MKRYAGTAIVGLVMCISVVASTFLLEGCGSDASGSSISSDQLVAVNRYFSEVIDQGKTSTVAEIFTPDAVQNFIGRPPVVGTEAIATGLTRLMSNMASVHTEVKNVIQQGDTVAAYVKHTIVGAPNGKFLNRTDIDPLLASMDGKTIVWEAMVFFRFEGAKIKEETIVRDELAMLMQMGKVTLTNP